MIKRSLRLTLAAMPLLLALLALAFVTLGEWRFLTVALVAGWGFVYGAIPVSWATWVTRTAPDQTESAGGLQVALIQVAITAGAGFGGVLLDHYGPRRPFIAAGAAALGAALIIFAKGRAGAAG